MMKTSAVTLIVVGALCTADAFQMGPGMKAPLATRRSALSVRTNVFETPVLRRGNGVLPLRVASGGESESELQSEVSVSTTQSPLMDVAKKAVVALAAFWQGVVAVFLSAIEEVKMFFAKIGMFFSNLFKKDRTDSGSDTAVKAVSVSESVSTTAELDPKAVESAKSTGIDASTVTIVAAVPASILALSALGDAATVDVAVTAAQGAAAIFALTYAMEIATTTIGTFLGTSDARKKDQKDEEVQA